jgi:hypothetical protein
LHDQGRLIELAGATRQIYELLKQEANGYCLDPLSCAGKMSYSPPESSKEPPNTTAA